MWQFRQLIAGISVVGPVYPISVMCILMSVEFYRERGTSPQLVYFLEFAEILLTRETIPSTWNQQKMTVALLCST